MDHHPAQPDPLDPESLRRGYEIHDVAAKPIVYFIIALIVFGGALQGAMSLVMRGYITHDSKAVVPSMDILRDHGDLTKTAPLQRDTTADMIKMYAEEDEILTTYAVDPKTKDVRIPLDRAFEVVARKGLPHREAPATSKATSRPIPTTGTAYKTTN